MGLTGATGPQGPQGTPGTNGTNGTGFNFTGPFSASTSYNVNDVATYNGSSYVAIVASQGAGTPDTNPTDWTLMAQQGAAGAQGLQGPQGPQGITGATGATGPQGLMGLQGPQGPPGVPPPNVAVTNAPNTFTASQTVTGNVIVSGTGNGVQFADGTVQTTAATTLGDVPSGFMILGTSPTAPAGYTLAGATTTGNTWLSAPAFASMPTQREWLATAPVNGKIYAIGGLYIDPVRNLGTVLGTVEVYDPVANTWTTAASMPTPRYGLTAVAFNGLIYAIGGNSSPGGTTVLDTLEIYNPTTNTWSSAERMPTPRAYLAGAVDSGLIYAIGGLGSGGTGALNTVEVYDPSRGFWIPDPPNMPTARLGLAATVANGNIYAIGGVSAAGTTLNTVEVLAVTPHYSWSTASTMPTPRSELAADTLNGKIYAIGGLTGGLTGGFLGNVEVFDPPSNSWGTAPSMLSALGALAASDVNGLLYAIGGANGTGAKPVVQNTVQQFSPPITRYLFTKN